MSFCLRQDERIDRMAVARVTPTEKKRPRCSGRAFQNACCSGESSRRASRRVGRVCEWMRQMDLALYRGMFVGGRGKRVTRDGLQVDGRKQERPTSNSSRAGTRSIATLVHAEWRKRQGRSSEAARPRLDQLAPWTWIARHHLLDDREPPLGWVRAS